MLKLQLGRPYQFTLEDGSTRVITIRGTGADPSGSTFIDLEVDGARRSYPSLDAALGQPFTRVERI